MNRTYMKIFTFYIIGFLNVAYWFPEHAAYYIALASISALILFFEIIDTTTKNKK